MEEGTMQNADGEFDLVQWGSAATKWELADDMQ